MITEDYVSFEVANLLKEKGFDELCDKKYNGYKSIVPAGKMIELWQNSEFDVDEECSSPTLQMTMKWLREIYHIHIRLINSGDESYRYEIYPREGKYRSSCLSDRCYYETYEKAAESAIKYCLEKII